MELQHRPNEVGELIDLGVGELGTPILNNLRQRDGIRLVDVYKVA